jgi:hypothetical protein
MLQELRSTSGKSMFVFGDSRSIQMEAYAPKWLDIPLGGACMSFGNYGNTDIWTQTTESWTTTTNPGSLSLIGWAEAHTIFAYTATAWANNTRIRMGSNLSINYGSDFRLTNPGGFSCYATLAAENNGVVGNDIILQAYVGGANDISTVRRQSSGSSTYYADGYSQVLLSVSFDDTTNWTYGPSDYYVNMEIALRTGATSVIGENIRVTDAGWTETNDGTGCVLHDVSLSGSTLGQIISDIAMPPTILSNYLQTRATRSPWFLIDKGSNPTSGALATKDWHMHQLRKAIAKLRLNVGDQNAKILLRTAYPTSTDDSTVYYQQAAIEVAKNDPGVICIDTYAAAIDGGGYSAASSKGFMGDTVHRNPTGRNALETMFNFIVSGRNWTYSATCG